MFIQCSYKSTILHLSTLKVHWENVGCRFFRSKDNAGLVTILRSEPSSYSLGKSCLQVRPYIFFPYRVKPRFLVMLKSTLVTEEEKKNEKERGILLSRRESTRGCCRAVGSSLGSQTPPVIKLPAPALASDAQVAKRRRRDVLLHQRRHDGGRSVRRGVVVRRDRGRRSRRRRILGDEAMAQSAEALLPLLKLGNDGRRLLRSRRRSDGGGSRAARSGSCDQRRRSTLLLLLFIASGRLVDVAVERATVSVVVSVDRFFDFGSGRRRHELLIFLVQDQELLAPLVPVSDPKKRRESQRRSSPNLQQNMDYRCEDRRKKKKLAS